ncbi:MAG: hypothetical protein DWP97_07985 [Calditrichaeota bacterium]|nr:MAG: hypothetical protein DWP97_07985 [Calditrichota bacterium]
MKNPFADNFEEERQRLESKDTDKSQIELQKELLDKHSLYSQYYLEVFKVLSIGLYLTIRTDFYFPSILQSISIDKFMIYTGIFILLISVILGTIVVLSIMLFALKYWLNSGSVFGIFRYLNHLPGIGEKPKPVIPKFKLLFYIVLFEICIDFFFIIDQFV